MSVATITLTPLVEGNYLLEGNLTFKTIGKHTVGILNFTQAKASLHIDLQRVGKIDSAGLALLIEWIKISRAQNKILRFDNIPTSLSALAKLSYLSEIDLLTTKKNNNEHYG